MLWFKFRGSLLLADRPPKKYRETHQFLGKALDLTLGWRRTTLMLSKHGALNKH